LTTRALIGEILALRQEEAKLLGYPSFGEVSVVPKMAESPQQIISFLRDLATQVRARLPRSDMADLREFAA
jgi:oligopeptidase A